MTFLEKLTAWNNDEEWGAASRLAREVGAAPGLVSTWVAGKMPGDKYLPKVCRVLKVTPDELAAMIRASKKKSETAGPSEPEYPYVNLKIVGVAPAGSPSDAFENYQGDYPVPRDVLGSRADNCRLIRARGRSMEGVGIFDGYLVAYHRQETAAEGALVVAWVENDGVTIKELKRKKGKLVLSPANDAFEDITDPFKIIGEVLWCGGRPGRNP